MEIKNKTYFKSLDKIAKHPAVNEIWDEGDDGLWIGLKYPHASPSSQVGTIHEHSCKALQAGFAEFLKCPMRYTDDGRGVIPANLK